MSEKIFIVEIKNYEKFIDAEKDFHGDSDEEKNDIVILMNKIEFVDSDTFRIENGNLTIDNKDLFYFDGTQYGYYNNVFSNSDYIYYCLDGCWYE